MTPPTAPARTFPSVANHAIAITPSDTANLIAAAAIWVGVTGNIYVDTVGGETNVLFANYPVGWLPVWVTKVYAAGTTASSLTAAWG